MEEGPQIITPSPSPWNVLKNYSAIVGPWFPLDFSLNPHIIPFNKWNSVSAGPLRWPGEGETDLQRKRPNLAP